MQLCWRSAQSKRRKARGGEGRGSPGEVLYSSNVIYPPAFSSPYTLATLPFIIMQYDYHHSDQFILLPLPCSLYT